MASVTLDLWATLEAERRSGRVTTFADWLAEHPIAPERYTQTVAGIVQRSEGGTPFMTAVRELLDEFKLRPAELRQRAIDDEPAMLHDARLDAYLGGLAEHLSAGHDLTRPGWTSHPARFLDRFWFPGDVRGFRAMAIAESPAAFRRRGIFIAAASLSRC